MTLFLRKYWKQVGLSLILLVLVIVTAGPPLFHTLINRKIHQTLDGLGRRLGAVATIGSISFPTQTSIVLTEFTLRPDSIRPALIRINALAVDFYIGGFITGSYIRRVTIDSMFVDVVREGDTTYNVSGMMMSRSSVSSQTSEQEAPQNRIAKWLEGYLATKLPSLEINHLFASYTEPYKKRRSDREEILLKDFTILLRESFFKDARLEVRGTIEQDNVANYLVADGTLNHRNQKIQLNTFFSLPFRMPFVRHRLKGNVYLKGVDAEIHSLFDEGDRSELKASLSLTDVEIESEAIADKKLKNINIGFDLDLDYGRTDIRIRPTTRVFLNRIQTFLDGVIDSLDSDPRLMIRATIPSLSMDDFLSSIPSALLTKIDGMKVKGSFEFKAGLELDLGMLDSTKYSAEVSVSDDFRVLSLGDSIEIVPFRDTFQYTFETLAEQDSSFWVGPMNPYYVPLDSLPPALVNAILYCEDNSFFKNDGFNTLQIGRSIRDNIRAGKFARGASTISMQWTKNIYLSREKTIARKFQELILTWLINHEKLLDKARQKEAHKKRLLEIYLNIIEWGPDVRGIGRASEFYFRKKPRDLTVGEAVFLATIIPNPKKYERYFEDGQVVRKHQQFMNWVVKMLEEKDIIDSTQLRLSFPASFKVIGEARQFIKGIGEADSLELAGDIEYRQSIME